MPTSPQARGFGATLAAGEDAALAGWSAAAFYGLSKRWEPFELVSPRQKRIDGLNVRVCRTLGSRDIWRFDGLRVTSPARTALDLAHRVPEKRLHKIVDHLRLRHKLKLGMLLDIVARNPRHAGARPLRALLRVLGRNASRSALERRWPAVAERYGIGPYVQNETVAGYEVDVLIDGLLIVEIDTVETHLLNFESDRHRDADILARTGIPTIRLLDSDLDGEMAPHAANIHATLKRERARRAALAS